MKKSLMLLLMTVFTIPYIAFADDFMPKKLEISSFGYSTYFNLNGEGFPVSITGGDAMVFLAVFTKDRAHEIKKVNSDHLPWHTVNQVDTCIYISPPHFLTEGQHYIKWDGRSTEVDLIGSGDYYFYLWAIETGNPKQLVSHDVVVPPGGGIIQTHDYEGTSITQPVFYPAANVFATGTDSVTVTRSRWRIGTDPLDSFAIEQTWCKGGPNWAERGPLAFSPYSQDMFYTCGYDLNGDDWRGLPTVGQIRRFTWVTGGEAVLDRSWGEEGMVAFSTEYPVENLRDPGAVYIGEDAIIASAFVPDGDMIKSQMPIIDAVEGYIVYTIASEQWWEPYPYKMDSEPMAESMKFHVVHGEPRLIFNNHLDCLYVILNPQDPYWDWLRSATDFWIPDEWSARGIPSLDSQGFTLIPGLGLDSRSIGLLAPDGTWVGMLPVASVDVPGNMMLPVNYGSAYDGLYFDSGEESGLWYRGYDTFRGIIDMGHVWKYLEIIAPNGGEVLQAKSMYTIEAYHSTPWGNSMVYLKYSIDNGKSWALIDSMFVSGGEFSYDWSVPNVFSDSCRIRVETYYINPVAYEESDSTFTIVGTADVEDTSPLTFTIFPSSPNPFNPSTTIEFILPEESHVRVTIFNALGQRVERLQDGMLGAGRHRVVWNAGDMGPGLYFYRVETDAVTKTGKMMLVK